MNIKYGLCNTDDMWYVRHCVTISVDFMIKQDGPTLVDCSTQVKALPVGFSDLRSLDFSFRNTKIALEISFPDFLKNF